MTSYMFTLYALYGLKAVDRLEVVGQFEGSPFEKLSAKSYNPITNSQ